MNDIRDFAAVIGRMAEIEDKADKHNALIVAVRAIYGMDFMTWPAEISAAVDLAHDDLFGVGVETEW